jgi:hypothetical protein
VCPFHRACLDFNSTLGSMKTFYHLPFYLLLASIINLPPPAQGKPLSYVGGTMVMQENDETGHTLSIDYTFDPHFAIGLYAKDEIGGKKFDTIGPQFNALIKRWNLPDGQGNIFSMTGAGMSRQGSKNEPAAWAALLADYETRRVFLSYEPRVMSAGKIETSIPGSYSGWIIIRQRMTTSSSPPCFGFFIRQSGLKPDTAATTTSWSTGPCNSEGGEHYASDFVNTCCLGRPIELSFGGNNHNRGQRYGVRVLRHRHRKDVSKAT